ncbi:hypothetical protein LOK49_Contig207G00003 [Camellia lanceoleosa]|nr:hypothetical protein LOK49_Contig207G00003 [Camellia lanceoleosa]
MRTDVESSYHLCQLAHPLLKASGYGSIVFSSSVAGVTALPAISVYAAAKDTCAINQLTRNLASEWAKDNIRTNTVAPWAVKTTIMKPNVGVHYDTWNTGVLGPITLKGLNEGTRDLTKQQWSYKVGLRGESLKLQTLDGSSSRSFPLTEEEYLLRLDDVASTLKCWGAVSHIRNSLAKLKERPRIGKVI